ncbi:putative S-receptor kinase [Melia azedarach]|uniref:S-receptor kinase n=1 Tax=Melia azedarach TaxID=155640 RepID=A0ACC1Z2X5_MELAZ|nr:putative S-receptor kinase [Melia azedarach]
MNQKTWCSLRFLLFSYFLLLKIHLSRGSDAISPGQSLSGNETLTSAEGIFELGFFTPADSQNYYIGIWYKSLPERTVVWVANRKRAVNDPFSTSLKLLEDGNLVLLHRSGVVIWSTNSTSKVLNSTTAKLLDNGNFVVRDASDSSSVFWQSFDHPTDSWLPGGKVGYNKLTNEKQILLSWRSSQNPAPGLFSLELQQNRTNHLLLWNGSKEYWNSGELGKIFTLVPPYVTNFTHILNENESYFTYSADIPNVFTRFTVDANGEYSQILWRTDLGKWTVIWTRPTEQCEVYAFCGPFSVCSQQKKPVCFCMEGFEPKMRKNWEQGDHIDGCVRRVPSECDVGGKDKFLVMPNMRFRDNSESLAVRTTEECELACLRNCSCSAFAYDNICLIWTDSLYNLQQLGSDEGIGRDFHIRIPASYKIGTSGKDKRKTLRIASATIAASFTLFAAILVILRRKRLGSGDAFEAGEDSLILFKYRDLKCATKNFSVKLGEGAFGSVFRGTLSNLTAVAVKELKHLNRSHEKQFRTEVKTIGMIQHINLVRLWGICVESSKRFLVYEYMPNGSLASLLFGESAQILDWQTRYKIAIGTARGLAYLHEKCRDCIIHCDIKPENILLDAEYNPKVADFGLAKMLDRDFSRVLTTMRGTRGYLAPEWISGEPVTPKADVYSYGMLLLETISGRRNLDLLQDEWVDNYFPIRVANTVYNREDVLALLDNRLEGNAIIEELTRACKISCWCIQDSEKDRPTMGQVIQVLEGLSVVNIPPIPRFLQSLAEDSSSSLFVLENYSTSVDIQSMN